jgi:outer membrane protein assembly factor BamB
MFRDETVVLRALLVAAVLCTVARADWPQFRGPNADNVSGEKDLPLTWSESENLLWKTPLPGPGSSSPIVVGDKIFVTCYSGYGLSKKTPGAIENLQRHLLCVRTTDGEILWNSTVPAELPEDPFGGYLVEHGYASSTPVSDGKRVYVFFGKTGALAFDMDGRQLWKVGLGKESNRRRWGSASSPILYKDTVIVTAAEESQSIRALDKLTGKEIWKAEAGMLTLTYNTPVLADTGSGRIDLIVAVPDELWGLNPDTGKVVWYTTTNIPGNVTPSICTQGGVAYAFGGYPRQGSIAVRLGGKGDVSQSHVVWKSRLSPYVPTPILHEERLHWIDRRGYAHCVDAKTGEAVYREKLQSDGVTPKVYASPLRAVDKLYATTRNAGTFVLQVGPEFRQLARNLFASDTTDFNGTPAVSDGRLYLRSNQFLYAVGNE